MHTYLGAGSLEDGTAGHEHVYTSLGDGSDVVHSHAAARGEGGGRVEVVVAVRGVGALVIIVLIVAAVRSSGT